MSDYSYFNAFSKPSPRPSPPPRPQQPPPTPTRDAPPLTQKPVKPAPR